MQAPVQDARNHHIPRKPRTMQKEEKRDRQFRRKAEILRRLAANRQDGGQNHGGHQHHGETIGQEAGHGRSFRHRFCLKRASLSLIMISDAKINSYHDLR
ncbi:hypothetical protein D3C72_1017410 [compost metagenome]